MSAYLLTWKDQRRNSPSDRGWPYAKLRALIDRFNENGWAEEMWRFQSHRAVSIGDEVFLFKQGDGPKGVFGVGVVADRPKFVSEQGAAASKAQWRARVRFERLVDPTSGFLIPHAVVQHIAPDHNVWRSQASGVRLPEDVAVALRRALGSAANPPQVTMVGEPWTDDEVRLVVADYFSMLRDELRGHPYNKAMHNAALREKLGGRSKAAVELKHANISAVLSGLGLPFIEGYKPRGNFQQSLAVEDQAVLEGDLSLQDVLEAALDGVPSRDFAAAASLSAFDEVPPQRGVAGGRPARPFLPRKFDADGRAAADEKNRALGRAGEAFVVELEKARLAASGCAVLAEKVRWVARDEGDGAGYDVLSFEADGMPRYIEVKTTNGLATTPFFVTANEVAFSCENGDRFALYRVYAFRHSPRVFVLRGSMSQMLDLSPTVYRAVVRHTQDGSS